MLVMKPKTLSRGSDYFDAGRILQDFRDDLDSIQQMLKIVLAVDPLGIRNEKLQARRKVNSLDSLGNHHFALGDGPLHLLAHKDRAIGHLGKHQNQHGTSFDCLQDLGTIVLPRHNIPGCYPALDSVRL